MVNNVLGGVNNLKKTIKSTPIEARDVLVKNNNDDIKLVKKAIDVGFDIVKERKSIELEKNKLIADEALNRYREALYKTNNPEEFDMLVDVANNDIKNYFAKSHGGEEFWNKYGDSLIEKNNQDIKNIRRQKEYDFGKRNLHQLLIDNQNMLVRSDEKRTELLFDDAINNIDNTKFLTEGEKKIYKDEYLKKAVLNVALNDVNLAKKLNNKFLPDNLDDISLKIDKIEKAKKDEEEKLLKKIQDENYLNKTKNAFSLWRDFEKGNISKSQYLVLSDELGDEFVLNENVKFEEMPLTKIYENIKNIKGNDSVKLNETSKLLMNAFKQNKFNIDEVSFLHEMLLAKDDGIFSFDDEIDDFADRVFMKDVKSSNFNLRELMEDKANLALSLHEVYGEKKREIFNNFLAQGGNLSKSNILKLKKQALNETKDDLGFVENKDGVLSFSYLNSILKQHYRGVDEKYIWKRFYKEAPFVEDKKELLIKIANQEQNLELNYPKFDRWADVEASGFEVGDKFYYRGRLAVKQV